MRNLLLLTAVIFTISCFGQKGKGGGGAAPAGGAAAAPSTSANSSQIQPGYSYIIKKGVFMDYIYHKLKILKITKPTFIELVKDLDAVPLKKGSLVWVYEVVEGKKDSLLILIEKAGKMKLAKGSIIQLPNGALSTDYTNTTNYTIIGVSQNKDGSLLTTTIKDTAMWVADTVKVNYMGGRLRVAVTQDSGNLVLDIKTSRIWENNDAIEKEYKDKLNNYKNTYGTEGIDFSTYDPSPPKDLITVRTSSKIGWKGKTTKIQGREISFKDSLQNFHIVIGKSDYVSSPVYIRKLHYNMVQYGVTTIPFQYMPGYHSAYRTVNSPTVAISPANLNMAAITPTTSAAYLYESQLQQPQGTAVPSNATATINGAAYFGWEWGATKFFNDPSRTYTGLSFVLAGFVGPTIMSLTTANTFTNIPTKGTPSSYTYITSTNTTSTVTATNYIPNTYITTQGGTYTQIGITYGISANANYQNFNLGLFMGMNSPIGADARTYFYSNKIWFGFGIGFNLGMFVSGTPSGVKQ